MKKTMLSKNKKIKIAVYFCLLSLVFNFSLVRAEETTVIMDTSPAPETPITEVPALAPTTELAPTVSSGEATTVEPEAPVDITPLIPPLSGGSLPVEPTPQNFNLTPLNPSLEEGQGAENLMPLITTTTEPIVFDFGQPATTETPEANNNVAGVSESAGASNPPVSREVITGIIRDANIKGLTILAEWQMSDEKTEGKYLGKDESAEAGAQFLPSGKFQVNKTVAVCALVADAGGAADLNNISASINYPATVAKTINQAGDASAGSAQVKIGCGQLKAEVNLEKINSVDAIALVCDKLRSSNNNLLAWGSDKTDNLIYSYEHVCGKDGLFEKQAAELYCAETALAYDDPAGEYQIKISAKNNSGLEITGENYLKYLELTTFENDFSDILYGPVKLNELKILKGDLTFATSTAPTVRNTGNTRLQIKIWQNDFGLGKTGDLWNLAYQARVGTSTDFISYVPEQTTFLDGVLELGQSSAMDFSVLINKFPDNNSAYWGKMLLSADKAPALGCE